MATHPAVLSDWPVLLVDLPGHGASRTISTTDFADVSRQLSATLLEQGIERYWLLGYSLGGRIAMYHACNGQHDGMLGLLVEGGHPGLATPELRTERIHHDARWAQRFRQEPLPAVLQDWYQQAVFADVGSTRREQLIARRSANHGASVAAMLEATSLGRQPFFGGTAPAPVDTFCLLMRCQRRQISNAGGAIRPAVTERGSGGS